MYYVVKKVTRLGTSLGLHATHRAEGMLRVLHYVRLALHAHSAPFRRFSELN